MLFSWGDRIRFGVPVVKNLEEIDEIVLQLVLVLELGRRCKSPLR